MRKDWDNIISKAVSRYETPFYLFDEDRINDSLESLKILETVPAKIYHWFSFKTNPVKQFIIKIAEFGYGLEVVSEYEFLASIKILKRPSGIVINGVNKQTWLNKYHYNNLIVNFDSLLEVEKLISLAKKCNWVIGLRYHPKVEVDPDNPLFTTQFGMTSDEVIEAKKIIESHSCSISTIHFHIGTQVINAESYKNAIEETLNLCLKSKLCPHNFSCGGGFPIDYNYNNCKKQFLKDIIRYIKLIPQKLKSVKSLWFENGRFVSGKSAILVVKINNIKYREGIQFFICDGGRTNHALVSDWEQHKFSIFPTKKSKTNIMTTVCGPTCMSFDHFIRSEMPSNIKAGDYFIWYDAGAYHIPWETRFSNGLSSIVWHKNKQFKIIREKENFESWWGVWR